MRPTLAEPPRADAVFILLGSRAARAWFPDFRRPSDWDAIASHEAISRWADRNRARITSLTRKSDRKMACRMHGGVRIEFELLGSNPSTEMLAEMARARRFKPTIFPGGVAAYAATPAVLWLTKRSHAYWPIHWEKTMADLHWLKARAAPATAAELAYYEARLAENKARLGDRKAKLDMSNEAFFAKSERAVRRVVEHDRLHEWVAYYDRPLFERFKTDLSKAALSRALFEQAPMLDKLRLVREEAMVIALERYLIPGKLTDPAEAYASALKRICTTLTSGWFRDFAIDHWPILNTPDKDFAPPVMARIAA